MARLPEIQKHSRRGLAADHRRTQGRITSSHQELVRTFQGDKGNIRHSLRILEARGWIVMGRSAGGKAASLLCCSLEKVRKGLSKLQEVRIKRKKPCKQRGRLSEIIRG